VNLAILGATGSIGSSTLDVVARHPNRYRVFALSANGSADALLALCRTHRPVYAVLSGTAPDAKLAASFAQCGTELLFGARALEQVAADSRVDLVMAAIVGAAGLRSTLAAARAGKRVLLANKEALVMAGPLLMRATREGGATLLPVDSEHSAIFQCLAGARADDVSRIILTASGGPFRTASLETMASATAAQAVAHPNWSMGAKISVDSATLMNKGLELIEAHYLFGLPSKRIDVLVHPQSVIHSLVEFVDGSMLAQLGCPDMRIPIAYALAWPERVETPAERLDLAAIARLDFDQPDLSRFPALRIAREALEVGGAAPVVLNAANEIAVAAFLDGCVAFPEIAQLVEGALAEARFDAPRSIVDVLEIDRVTRERSRAMLKASCS
jgi:1-deoxy-D-xylulose-5-phosphate reductoisomerase